MDKLRDLFHQPALRTIGGVEFAVYKLAFEQFDDALLLGAHIAALDAGARDPIRALQALKSGTPERAALERLVAGCLAVAGQDAAPRPLTAADVQAMPLVMLAQAIGEIVEVNLDFFTQTLPRLATLAARMGSIGSALPSNSSAPGTASATSPATASPNSGAT